MNACFAVSKPICVNSEGGYGCITPDSKESMDQRSRSRFRYLISQFIFIKIAFGTSLKNKNKKLYELLFRMSLLIFIEKYTRVIPQDKFLRV